ncbi:MAG: hypothetical protein Q8M08_00340 [Bacteroidales bacterium]|nr:hypothetical protein [Bacteroidales bacterium]
MTRDTLHLTRRGLPVTKYHPPATIHLFKASLHLKKHHITGLLVIKRMETPPFSGNTPPPTPPQTGRGDCPAVYRIVFMNEVGMTFFDMEMKTDSFTVISCFESLNKQALVKILETDFRMLVGMDSLNTGKVFRQKGTNRMVVSGTAGKYKIWQTFSSSGDTLYTTAAKSTIADPVIIDYNNYAKGVPLKITISNPFIGMKLSLRKLASD